MTNAVHYISYSNFLEYYSKKICPSFCEIDTCLKTAGTVPIVKAATLLEISPSEIQDIMISQGINEITKEDFLKIMLLGSSYLCQLFKREMECGCPTLYSPWQVSYIYNLDAYIVSEIFNTLGIEVATAKTLPDIFGFIQLATE